MRQLESFIKGVSMSLAKRCQEILSYGDVDARYEAARFMIISAAQHQGQTSKEFYGRLIHDYCLRYNLSKRKLGLLIQQAE